MRPLLRLSLALSSIGCALAWPSLLAAQPAQPAPAAPTGARPTLPPLPYTVVPALGGMRFDNPIDIVPAPGNEKGLFIVERKGRIIEISDVTKPDEKVVLDIQKEVGSLNIERGLLALAFHPDFKRNHQFYVWLTLDTETAGGKGLHDQLSRFNMSATDPDVADPASEQPMISQYDRAANHNGGQILFGPDGYLYLSMGDEGDRDGSFGNTQLIDKNFFSGIIRIDVDKRPGSLAPNPHPSVHPGTYTIPTDNPFVGAKSFDGLPVDPAKVRTEFYAVGLRNTFRMSIDPETKLIWAGDVGQDRVEEVDLIRSGGNYGWNYIEGNEAFKGKTDANGVPLATSTFSGRTPPPDLTFDAPIYTYLHTNVNPLPPLPSLTPADRRASTTTGNCIIGGIVYHGKAYPDLTGKYIFGDNNTNGKIWALTPGPVTKNKDGSLSMADVKVEQISRMTGIVSFGVDPQTDEILIANITAGQIMKLARTPPPVAASAP